jgi:glycosyltransferase involved in cell wall biosynthesis
VKVPKVIHLADLIAPGGGPPGYLYNLREAVADNGVNNVEILALNETQVRGNRLGSIKSLVNRLPIYLENAIRSAYARHVTRKLAVLDTKLQDASIVICHTALVARAVVNRRRILGIGRVGAMFHSPTPDYVQYRDTLLGSRRGVDFSPGLERKLIMQEKQLIQDVDFLVAPCEEALENWYADSYLGTDVQNKQKYFTLSGVPGLRATAPVVELRRSLGLDPESVVVGFFGRYFDHKGYDVFVRMAQRYRNNRGVVFISAGTGPLASLNDGAVRDFGWRPDIGDLISAVDIVALPNRVTYFDLVALEALSLGRRLLLSSIGGNRYLLGLAPAVVHKIAENGAVEGSLLRATTENESLLARDIYRRCFSTRQFAQGHEQLAYCLLNQGRKFK